MFRREMGSKRGSLPPKGDLTCMRLSVLSEFRFSNDSPFYIFPLGVFIPMQGATTRSRRLMRACSAVYWTEGRE